MEAGLDQHVDKQPQGNSLSDGEGEVKQESDPYTAHHVDLSNLPEYDENYTSEDQHRITFALLVRNLEATTDQIFADYMAKIQNILPSHDFSKSDHMRLKHDAVACYPEDIDPFGLKETKSFSQALGIDTMPLDSIRQEEEEEDYNNFYNLDPNDLDGFGPSGIDNNTREL